MKKRVFFYTFRYDLDFFVFLQKKYEQRHRAIPKF